MLPIFRKLKMSSSNKKKIVQDTYLEILSVRYVKVNTTIKIQELFYLDKLEILNIIVEWYCF